MDRVLARLDGELDETLTVRDLESRAAPRRRATACSRRRPRIERAGLDFAQARRRGHRRRQRARSSTPIEKGWLARFPDVGLGRRAHLASCRAVGPAAGGAAGHRHRRACSPARAPGRGHARARRRARTRRRCWRSMWYHAGGRQGREGHGDPALQGPARAVLALPAAAGDGVARQGEGPRRQGGAPGHRRLRQQGLDRSARLRAAAPRGRATTSSSPSSRCCRIATASRLRVEAERDRRRLPRRLPARHAARALRERPRVDHAHHPTTSTRAPSACSSRCTSAPSGSTRRWSNINAYHQPGVEAGKKAAARGAGAAGQGARRCSAKSAGRR